MPFTDRSLDQDLREVFLVVRRAGPERLAVVVFFARRVVAVLALTGLRAGLRAAGFALGVVAFFT